MQIPEVTCGEAISMRDAGAAWIDVREVGEWEQFRIADTELIPLADAASEVPRRWPNLDAPMVISCHSGARSGHLVDALRNAGYTDVHNLRGGIMAWASEGRDVISGPS